jgi:hypothetical protein
MMAAKAYMAMTAFPLKAMSTAVNGGALFVGRLRVASQARPLSPSCNPCVAPAAANAASSLDTCLAGRTR